MAEGASNGRSGIDPKVVAALVNRFIADSASFLQNFAQQCEVKLLTLSRRIERLERLIELFERKVHGLEPGDAPTVRTARVPSTQEVSADAGIPAPDDTSPTVQDALPDVIVDPIAPATAPETPEALVVDERYEKYIKMNRVGINIVAVRQKFLMDMNDDPSLDLNVFDKLFDSAGASAPPLRKNSAPKASSAAPGDAAAGGNAATVASAPAEDMPEQQNRQDDELPVQVGANAVGLAAAAAMAAQKRRSRSAASSPEKAAGAPPSEAESPSSPPTTTQPPAPPAGPPVTTQPPAPAVGPPVTTQPPAPAVNPPLFSGGAKASGGGGKGKAAKGAATDAQPASTPAPAAPQAPEPAAAAPVVAAPAAKKSGPPMPQKGKGKSKLSPEAKMKARRAAVNSDDEDDGNSDVGDFDR